MKIILLLATLMVFIPSIQIRSFASTDAPLAANPSTGTNGIHKGTVLSSFDEDGYTYIKYQENNSVSWVAVLQVALKVNDLIEFPDTPPVTNYQSRTLQEPFERIIFATEIQIAEPVKPASVSSEPKSDTVVISAQAEGVAEKPVAAASEENKTEESPPPKAEAKKSEGHRGRVISYLNTIGYTYIECEEDGVVSWVAVPETVVKAGDIIEFPNTQILNNFGSKTLQKTFERLYMVSELRIVPKEGEEQTKIE